LTLQNNQEGYRTTVPLPLNDATGGVISNHHGKAVPKIIKYYVYILNYSSLYIYFDEFSAPKTIILSSKQYLQTVVNRISYGARAFKAPFFKRGGGGGGGFFFFFLKNPFR